MAPGLEAIDPNLLAFSAGFVSNIFFRGQGRDWDLSSAVNIPTNATMDGLCIWGLLRSSVGLYFDYNLTGDVNPLWVLGGLGSILLYLLEFRINERGIALAADLPGGNRIMILGSPDVFNPHATPSAVIGGAINERKSKRQLLDTKNSICGKVGGQQKWINYCRENNIDPNSV